MIRTSTTTVRSASLEVNCCPDSVAVAADNDDDKNVDDDGRPLLVLRCFAPEGTPIQGREFALTSRGATLGRRQGNTVSFSHRVVTRPDVKVLLGGRDGEGAEGGAALIDGDDDGNPSSPLDCRDRGDSDVGNSDRSCSLPLTTTTTKTGKNAMTTTTTSNHQYVGIDSSISGEHARIIRDPNTGSLFLYDGAGSASNANATSMATTSSTNGTWVRLGRAHERSDWFALEDGMEVLVGTVRFQVKVDEIVVERDIH